jgi:PIN domain nuclease of toxin-antitoxin system
MGAFMRLLLDTCTFVWLTVEPGRLSEVAVQALDSETNDLFLSHASIWEIHLKHLAGKLKLPQSPRIWISKQLTTRGITDWPIDLETLHQSSEFPLHHKDPFDRLIIAQASVHQLHIVTPDAAFRPYELRLIW